MIEKLQKHEIIRHGVVIEKQGCEPREIIDKINELVDAVNEFQKILHDVVNESVKNMSWVESLENAVFELRAKVNKMAPNINFAQPEVKENVQDPYAEQRKWVGKVCRFRNELFEPDCWDYGVLEDVGTTMAGNFRSSDGYWYDICEPVKPDDDIIYKGEQQ